jgi:hypothetical protein
MAVVETAPASQVEPAPPVFWILFPVTVKLTALVHMTGWQTTTVGVLVGVFVRVNVLEGVFE